VPAKQRLQLILSEARSIWAALSSTRRRRLVLLASLFVVALGSSAHLGSAHSPDYGTREAVMGYMVRHAHAVGRDKRCGLTLQMDAAGERYTFCSKSGKEPETRALTSAYNDTKFSLTKEDIEAGRTFVKEVLVPVGSAALTESLIARWMRVVERGVRTATLTAPQQRLFNAAAAVVVASGMYIGSRFGYREDKRFDNVMVLAVLKDPTVWTGISDLWRARDNLDEAQENIRVALQADPDALFTAFHVHGRQIRLSELQSEVDRRSAEVNKLLGRT